MHKQINRRGLLGKVALGAGAVTAIARFATAQDAAAADSVQPSPAPAPAAVLPAAAGFHFCLNTSTIRGQKLPLVEELDIAARAGYQAVEPWISELDQYVKDGGSLKELGKRIADLGLTVESVIGFPQWILDDDALRAKGVEEARRCMDITAQIGGKRLAAPPAGATNVHYANLLDVADRYRVLLEIGDTFGVVPQVEMWGHSKTLGRLGEAVMVAIESHHPKACVLADVYHMHKGGSDPESLRLLGAETMHVMHLNDYPAEPGRAEISDAQRVYPGDGSAPLRQIFRTLRQIGFHGYLSLELFNRDYWRQDAYQVARTGLEKARVLVQASMEEQK